MWSTIFCYCLVFIVPLSSALLLLPALSECKPGQFNCTTTGECLDAKLRCDHVNDCPDGADEKGCDDQYKSLTSQLCRDVNLGNERKHYVAVCYFVSDGKNNCQDCSDELIGFNSKVYDTFGQFLSGSSIRYTESYQQISSFPTDQNTAVGDALENLMGEENTIDYSFTSIRNSGMIAPLSAPLRITPRLVTLVLGATFQLTSTGGPSDSEVEYSLENDHIASRSPDGIIQADHLGHTKLFARAVSIDHQSGKKTIYFNDHIVVNVIRLSGVRVVVPLTRIRQNTEMPVYIIGLNEDESPLSFGTCSPSLTIEWSLSNQHSGQLFSPFSWSMFSQRFRALQPGHTILRVRVTSQTNSGQLAHSELTDEVSVQVYESFYGVNPYSTIDDVLLMMPNTKFDFRTNLDSSAIIEYDVKGPSDIVHVDEKGIHSGLSLGSAYLVTRVTQHFGLTQSIKLPIEVATASYLMLTTSPKTSAVPITHHLSVLPVGFKLDLKLTYHDVLGRAFRSAHNQLIFQLTRLDVIHFRFDPENATLHINANTVGKTVLLVSDQLNPGLKEYLHFEVADVIQPQQVELVMGDVVCFSSPILSESGFIGKWSADEHFFHLDAEKGVGVAVGEGSADISYGISEKETTLTKVTISSVSSLQFEETTEPLVADPSVTYYFPLGFHKTKVKSLVGENCSTEAVNQFMRERASFLSCSLSFTSDEDVNIYNVLRANAEFDAETGFYRCAVKAVGNPTSVAQVILTAQYGSVSTQLELSFQPVISLRWFSQIVFSISLLFFLGISSIIYHAANQVAIESPNRHSTTESTIVSSSSSSTGYSSSYLRSSWSPSTTIGSPKRDSSGSPLLRRSHNSLSPSPIHANVFTPSPIHSMSDGSSPPLQRLNPFCRNSLAYLRSSRPCTSTPDLPGVQPPR